MKYYFSSFTMYMNLFIFGFLVVYLILLSFLAKSSSIYVLEYNLLEAGTFSFSFLFLLDYISAMFMFTVMLISMSVFVFGYYYMMGSDSVGWFFMILFLFVVSMGLLILSPNLMSLILGWDGLGLTSFLLVSFYLSPKSLSSGLLTFITNRLGDSLLIVSMGLLSYSFTWGLSFLLNEGVSPTMFMVCFLLGAFTKSAQVPFSAWLPAAMAAPTPVSALVHSSTLVTAGVYVVFRIYPYLSLVGMKTVFMFGSLTTLLAGLSACSELDMKKVVALSTLSQLGVMMSAIGAGIPFLGYMHLLIHAFFKALLFIAAGHMIHMSLSYQDLRMSSGLMQAAPFTSSVVFLTSVSLMGLPFLSSFYSKEVILELMMLSTSGCIVGGLYTLGVVLTILYSIRFFYKGSYVMLSKSPVSLFVEESLALVIPMMILLLPGILGGAWVSQLLGNSFIYAPAAGVFSSCILSVLVGGIVLESLWHIRSGIILSNFFDFASKMWNLPEMMSVYFRVIPQFFMSMVYGGGLSVNLRHYYGLFYMSPSHISLSQWKSGLMSLYVMFSLILLLLVLF